MLREESGESDADGENGTLIYKYMNFRFLFLSVMYKKMVGIHREGESGSEKMRGRISRGF
jgi:hypothetical protein